MVRFTGCTSAKFQLYCRCRIAGSGFDGWVRQNQIVIRLSRQCQRHIFKTGFNKADSMTGFTLDLIHSGNRLGTALLILFS